MNRRNRLFLLIGIMAVVSLAATGSALYTVYQNSLAEVKDRLFKSGQSQARLVEAIVEEHPREEALARIEETHERVSTSLRTAELLLVERTGDRIEFLSAHRSGEHLDIAPVRFDGPEAEASRRGLLRESGTMIGLDYRGVKVVAAYIPVRNTEWAIVAKADLEEVQAPFVRAGLVAILLDLGMVLLAAVLFMRFTSPLVERLQETERHHRTLFDQSFQMLWTLKPDGTVLEANRTALDTAGVIESAACGRPFWETRWWGGLLPEQQKLEWAVGEAAAGNLARMELDSRAFGNRTLTLDLALKPVTNRKGQVVMVTAEARDITERKQAEQELAERTTYLKALIENSPLGIVAHDAEGRVKLCNPAFERLFGYRREEIAGKSVDTLISTGERTTEAESITRQVIAGEVVQVTTRRRRSDGTLMDVAIHGVPLSINGQPAGGYGLYEDITERLRTEEEREKLLLELREALANIKTLSGLLPICASCKKIRDDGGYWSQIESYISERSQAQFSHGICPECAKQLYPEHFHKMFPEFEEEEQKDS